jgi:hypothetical protein
MLAARAYNGTNPSGFFYRTPAEFFTDSNGMAPEVQVLL